MVLCRSRRVESNKGSELMYEIVLSFFTTCLSDFTHAGLFLPRQFLLAVFRFTPESHLSSHPVESHLLSEFYILYKS